MENENENNIDEQHSTEEEVTSPEVANEGDETPDLVADEQEDTLEGQRSPAGGTPDLFSGEQEVTLEGQRSEDDRKNTPSLVSGEQEATLEGQSSPAGGTPDLFSDEQEATLQGQSSPGGEAQGGLVSGEQEVIPEGQRSPGGGTADVVFGDQEATLEGQRSPGGEAFGVVAGEQESVPEDRKPSEPHIDKGTSEPVPGEQEGSTEPSSVIKLEVIDPESEGHQEQRQDPIDENADKISETKTDKEISEEIENDLQNHRELEELKTNLPLNLEIEDRESELNQNFLTYSFDNESITESMNENASYVIEEYKESSYYLKFDINNSGTIFKIYLPTLKKIIEPEPEYDYKIRPRNKSPIKKAIQNAVERIKDHKILYGKDNLYKTAVITGNGHILRIERARRIKLRLKSNITAVKELPTPPEKHVPLVGSKKRPTEFPPMKFAAPSRRVGEGVTAARLRGAREQYNRRSDDAWIHRLRAQQPPRAADKPTVWATPPQNHDPWRNEAVPRPEVVKREPHRSISTSASRTVRAKQMHLSYRN